MCKGLNFVTVLICVITYYKSYYWLIRFRYFAYTISPSPWTYPSSGRYSLAAVAMHLLKLCCSLCCSPEYLQHAFFVLICKIQEKYFLLHSAVMWLIRLAALSWRNRPDFAFALLSTGSFRPIEKWSTRPRGLFTLPTALHAWERTCHFKHCSYVVFISNTVGIRGASVVKNIAVICHYNFRRTLCCDFVNTDTCVKMRQHIIVHLLYGHVVFYRDI